MAFFGTKKTIDVPAQIPALLSKAYFETDHFEKGVSTAVKYAENVMKEGQPDKAKKTLESLRTYQQNQGLPATGSTDTTTLNRLGVE